MEPKWSESIREAAAPQYGRILRHPFICGLADGSLPAECFARYLAQDELYLPAYGSMLHRLADMLPEEEDREFMHRFADSGGESEREMHRLLIERFSVDTDVSESPVTRGYISFLQAAADGGNAAGAAAAMLPCSWVYNNVGLHILGIAKMDGNPYREWISEYGNEEYGRDVRRMVSIADSLAEAAGAEAVTLMNRAFIEALGFEFAFWDYGYNCHMI